METRKNYPYLEALRDIREIVDKYIKNPESKATLYSILEKSKTEHRIAFQGLFENFLRFKQQENDQSPLNRYESQVFQDLAYFWR